MKKICKAASNLLIFLLAVFTLILSGCFWSSDDSSSHKSTELEGVWSNVCSDHNTESSYEIVTFYGTSFTSIEYNHSGAGCVASNIDTEFKYEGSISIGDEITTATNPETAKEVDVTLSRITATPKNQTTADFLNDKSMCGINSWALNVETDITGKTCDTDTMPSAGTVIYDIFAISGGTTLYFGDDSPPYTGDSAASRPIDLDKTDTYTKQ